MDNLGEDSQINSSAMPDEHLPITKCIVIAKHFDSDSIKKKEVINLAAGDRSNESKISTSKSNGEYAL